MVKQEFSTHMEDGTVNVADEQKKRILDLDESVLQWTEAHKRKVAIQA